MTTASDSLILLDTSIWIDYFRKSRPLFDHVESLIDQERVCMANLILAELLQGARSETEFATLKGSVEIFHLLEEKPDTWIEAARLSAQLRSEGKKIGLADCYLAQLAFQNHVMLWSLDKHFPAISQFLKMKLYKP